MVAGFDYSCKDLPGQINMAPRMGSAHVLMKAYTHRSCVDKNRDVAM